MLRTKPNLLWLQWVAANAIAEGLGLGATLVLDGWITMQIDARRNLGLTLLGVFAFTLSGLIEGALVGFLQWRVLKQVFPNIKRKSWMDATMLGAAIAWFLGSLPSTFIDISSQASGETIQEPPQLLVLLLAAGMGLVLGAVLASPQQRPLRQVVKNAWIWIPANAAAWMAGMPIIFSTIDLAFKQASLAGAILTGIAGLLIAGAAVGAIHGLALVWLASKSRPT